MLINNEALKQEYYKALVNKDVSYEGIFYAAITSTKIFCHCTCPARKPKYDNVIFYTTSKECLDNGYRPCKLCHPLDNPSKSSDLINYLVNEVNNNPNLKWDENDLYNLDIHPNTARRHFKNHYGITFKKYVIQVRIANSINSEENVIMQQLASGYESNSGYNYAIKKLLNKTPQEITSTKVLSLDCFNTKLGPMISICDNDYLYLLAFKSSKNLDLRIKKLLNSEESLLIGRTIISKQINNEINEYYNGSLKYFRTPYILRNSLFTMEVLLKVANIKYGSTASYQDIALLLGDISKARAVGLANSLNNLAIIIPCHRLLRKDGSLANYYGGINKKEYLLALEKGNIL